ncbi:MAG: hypothetical protein ACKVRO_18965 [Micropepsaceae bacterium]
MPTGDLPLWLKYLQAIALIVIPFVGAWIALGQLHVARTKLKHDLFERRFKLYDTAANFISHILMSEADNPAINKYSRDILDAEFLTSKSVSDYLDELRLQANSLHAIEVESRVTRDPETQSRLDIKSAERREWFSSQFQVLKNKFLPLIGFEEQRWGPPSSRM